MHFEVNSRTCWASPWLKRVCEARAHARHRQFHHTLSNPITPPSTTKNVNPTQHHLPHPPATSPQRNPIINDPINTNA